MGSALCVELESTQKLHFLPSSVSVAPREACAVCSLVLQQAILPVFGQQDRESWIAASITMMAIAGVPRQGRIFLFILLLLN